MTQRSGTAPLLHLGPFTDDELAEMRRCGICPCGIEDVVRDPLDVRSTVPTSAHCPWHVAEAAR